MVGHTISHYKILEKLGEGGMGVVYEAEDTRLRRPVALKILRPEASEDEGLRARLSKEAEIAASLDHLNITTVYEIDEADGRTFLAMPLVKGETLSKKIKQRPLPLSEALDIAIQIAEALHAAHSKGVVHRDIKPGNVMITTEGRVKVMDFGLAHLAGQTHITKTGAIMGTPAYMSPEQAQGRSADTRSDIWSLGVAIYEMVAGRQPFPGENAQSVMLSIIHEDHEPITALRVGVPPELDRVVGKAMAKKPGERYQHIEDMLVDLRALRAGATTSRQILPVRVSRRKLLRVGTGLLLVVVALALGLNANRLRDRFFGGSGPKIDSIAILPLRNLSGDPEQQYFSDGMTETLYTSLAKISALKVISPRSTRGYEGTNTTIRQIARELDVDAIVQGSAVRVGDQVRITAQLIDAATDENLWAESYERSFRDLLVLQSEMAQSIAQQVQARLTPEEAQRLASARPVNPQAYEAYLRGNFHFAGTLSREGLDAALRYYESALEHDPGYAPAYAGIALVWGSRKQMGQSSPEEAGAMVRQAVIKALELDSSLAESQYALACYRVWTEWDWEGAEQAFRRAIEINPNYADAHAFYSHLLLTMRRPEEAIAEMERALELDPTSNLLKALYGQALRSVRRHDEALALFRGVLEIEPNDPLASNGLIHTYHNMGMQDEAIAAQKEALARVFDSESAEAFSRVYAEQGYERALRAAAELRLADARFTLPWVIADLYLRAGDEELALDWLEKGFEVHDPSMPYISVFPKFDDLHDNPRFQDLLRRMNLAQH